MTQTITVDVARELGSAATGVDFASLSRATVDATSEALFDTLAVALGGVDSPGVPEARAALARWGTHGATVWGGFGEAPAPFAAIANGGALHALDYDDTDDGVPLHANSVVLPALLADVEDTRPDTRGHDFLASLAVGIDGAMRIGRAGGPRGSRGWNYSVISGGIGAILALARLRRWNDATTVSALGHELAQTAGSLQSIIDGSLAKRFQPAMVAKDVLVAAALAEAGITGPENVFEGRAGFFSLYQDGRFDRDILTAGLGDAALVEDLSLKPYPACRFTHSAIDLALRLRESGLEPGGIDKITFVVSGQAMNMVGRKFDYATANVVDAQFSVAYTTAVALHRGAVLIGDFEPARIGDPAIGAFVRDHVEVVPTDDVDFLSMTPIVARVRDVDGVTTETIGETVSGSPDARLSLEQLKLKAADCLRNGRSSVGVDELWDAVKALESDGPVRDLLALLGRSREETGR